MTVRYVDRMGKGVELLCAIYQCTVKKFTNRHLEINLLPEMIWEGPGDLMQQKI